MADSPCTMSAEAAETVKVEDGGDSDGPAPDRARRTLEEEFNTQRAKMKELFLQKEEEMRKLRQEKEHLESEVLSLRAELQQTQTLSENQKSEIQSLQLLVSETVEASSSGSEEARRLRARTLELEHQLAQLRQQQQEVSLAPATFVRSLARKLGADADDPPTRKAAEEGELARSLLAPLEQEVLALKAKLRDTDAQLQDAIAKAKATDATAASGDGNKEQEGARRCDMCANYEQQLVLEQAQAEAARERAQALDAALRLASDELEAVRALHDETIRAWTDERARGSARLDQLQAAVLDARRALEQRAAAAAAAEQRALTAVTHLTVERETLQGRLDSLERDNAMLIGQYTKKAADMQNEIIDLPDNVEELQEQTLRLREQLIFCEIGRSEASAAERSLRAQLLQQGALGARHEAALQALRAELRAAAEAPSWPTRARGSARCSRSWTTARRCSRTSCGCRSRCRCSCSASARPTPRCAGSTTRTCTSARRAARRCPRAARRCTAGTAAASSARRAWRTRCRRARASSRPGCVRCVARCCSRTPRPTSARSRRARPTSASHLVHTDQLDKLHLYIQIERYN